jgi:hypothetical protein
VVAEELAGGVVVLAGHHGRQLVDLGKHEQLSAGRPELSQVAAAGS